MQGIPPSIFCNMSQQEEQQQQPLPIIDFCSWLSDKNTMAAVDILDIHCTEEQFMQDYNIEDCTAEHLFGTHQPAQAGPANPRLIALYGPSGVGKSTLIRRLCREYPDTVAAGITHTTRPRRSDEVDGEYNYFRSETQFKEMIAKNAFVEHAILDGDYYGTSRESLGPWKVDGRTLLLDVDMEGIKQLRALSEHLPAQFVFVSPPNLAVLEDRLRARGTEDEDHIRRRLKRAVAEIDFACVSGAHDLIVVNDDLQRAYERLKDFVFSDPRKKEVEPEDDEVRD